MWSSALLVDDTEEVINDLLSRWHTWASQFVHVAGFNTCASAMQQFRASRQYDSENGALDQDVENRIMAAVDACIDRVEQPFRTALWINARNLVTGAAVWQSARLPADPLARAKVVTEARAKLADRLASRGML